MGSREWVRWKICMLPTKLELYSGDTRLGSFRVFTWSGRFGQFGLTVVAISVVWVISCLQDWRTLDEECAWQYCVDVRLADVTIRVSTCGLHAYNSVFYRWGWPSYAMSTRDLCHSDGSMRTKAANAHRYIGVSDAQLGTAITFICFDINVIYSIYMLLSSWNE